MENFADKISSLRREYSDKKVEISDLNINPLTQFTNWLDEAIESKIYEPNAMVLATSIDNMPRSRYVLFKNIIEENLVFYTNYNSPKAMEIEKNPLVSGIFYWPEIHRQVRFEGLISKTNPEISDEYFYSRPRGGQLSAWASDQSKVINSREEIEKEIENLDLKFQNETITRPPFWGGYKINVNYWEFWQGRKNRTHDRFCYTQELSKWTIERLSP